jgi:hypothetical protein
VTAAPRPSSTRLAIGALCFVAAIVMLPIAFLRLHAALEGPGYGSPEVRTVLIVLGVTGAALGTGVCLLVWEGAARLRKW